MPTYDYICTSCHHQFDVFQSIKAEPLAKCPKCGKTTRKRLIGSGGGLIFKGSGFYQTDYPSTDYTKSKEKESPPKTKTKNGEASRTDNE